DAVYHAALSGVNLGLVAAASAVVAAGPYAYEPTRPIGPGTGKLDCSGFVLATVSLIRGYCYGNFYTGSFAGDTPPSGFVRVTNPEPFDIVVDLGRPYSHMGFFLSWNNGLPVALSMGSSGFSVCTYGQGNCSGGGGRYRFYRFVGP